MAAWAGKKCLPPFPHPSTSETGGRAGTEALKRGELAWKISLLQDNAGELTLVMSASQSWKADQPCNYAGTEPGLWVGAPQYLPLL